MDNFRKLLTVFALVALLSLTFASTVYAFDGRDGDKVVIAADEVVNDDLYIVAQEFVLDGTVNGDVVAIGQTSTINGTIDGDLISGGQAVIVNGTVTGSIRVAGAVLLIGENASIEGDIIGAGSSLEVKEGSTVGQDLVFGGAQLLLAGDVTRNVKVGAGAFELRSTVGGNVEAQVDESGQASIPPTMFMPQISVSAPSVKPGLTFAPSARIEGDLEYTRSRDLALPAGVVAGQVTRNDPPTNQTQTAPRQETTGERISTWGFNLLRTAVTLILIGLFLLWLFPFFMRGWSEKLQAAPWRSLGWGALAWVGAFFVGLLIVAATIMGTLVFGLMTLGGLAGSIVSLGLLSLFALILGFVLVTSFLAKVAFGQALGRWILARANSPLAEHRYWPMIIGVLITVAVVALFSFPLLISGILGWLLNLAVILFGLGALWLWNRERTVAIRPVG